MYQTLRKKLVMRIVEVAHKAREGHIPSSLSVLDILWTVYCSSVVRDGSAFILSKGHASVGLYVILEEAGLVERGSIDGYCSLGSRFGGHPDRNKIEAVLASTGSLGHGLPISVGLATTRLLEGSLDPVICLMGDGECNEGTTWESLHIAKTRRLSNLRIVIDLNLSGERALPLAQTLHSSLGGMGLIVHEIDGHDIESLKSALTIDYGGDGPAVIIARTIKGCGISFMENNPEWHHKIPSVADIDMIRSELGLEL